MKPRTARSVAVTALVTGLLAGATEVGATTGSSSTPPVSTTPGGSIPVMDPGDGGNYHPQLDPAEMTNVIDNPYLPLAVGSRWRYDGQSGGAHEINDVVVTADHKVVMGIDAVVVHDTVMSDGELTEDTYDWYAQDSEGNVWYLGEQSAELENGAVVSTAGSWEAGVDGAYPGIVMPAAPLVGDVYRQEYLAGEAEDMFQIVGLDASLTVPAGTYTDVVTTHDWSPLEPDVIEGKAYAPGVGVIQETTVAGGDDHSDLVEYTPGS